MRARAHLIGTIILVSGLLAVASPVLSAEPQPNYLALKAGIFEPEGDIAGFDTAFSGELDLGRRFHRNFAGELGLGYLRAGSERSRFDAFPLTVSGKAILPLGDLEPYATAGGGLYFARLEGDDDATFGAFLGGGVQFKIEGMTGRSGFIGLEAKHVWLKPSFEGVDVEARGFQVMALFGVVL